MRHKRGPALAVTALAIVCVLWGTGLIACSNAVQGMRSGASATAARKIRDGLAITEDFRDDLIHGEKGAAHQKYIVLHDSEGTGSAKELVGYWASNGDYAGTHFVVNKDGTIVQCVPLDAIAHHAGFGDTGHNELFGVEDESRDDRRGTVPLADWATDYGMNSYSVGITMVHAGDEGEAYPEEQLEAVDGLIAYIDAYYGFESDIIEHREWRTGAGGCSVEFAPYLQSYKTTRSHTSAITGGGDA